MFWFYIYRIKISPESGKSSSAVCVGPPFLAGSRHPLLGTMRMSFGGVVILIGMLQGGTGATKASQQNQKRDRPRKRDKNAADATSHKRDRFQRRKLDHAVGGAQGDACVTDLNCQSELECTCSTDSSGRRLFGAPSTGTHSSVHSLSECTCDASDRTGLIINIYSTHSQASGLRHAPR